MQGKSVMFVCTELDAHGGIQRFNRNLLSALADNNADIDVFSVNDKEFKSFADRPKVARYLFGASCSKLRWLLAVFKALISTRYDVYVCGHVNLAFAFQLLLLFSGKFHKSTILILHGVDVWGRIKGVKRFAAKRFLKVLAVSRYTLKSFLAQAAGFSDARAFVFPNTISPEWVNCHDLPVSSRKNHSSDEVVRLLSVTRLDRSERDKGLIHVLEALSLLKDKYRYEYKVIGDGNDRDYLQGLAEEYGIDHRVSFLGSVSDTDLLESYASADLFVLPSSKEGFGIVFLEAMFFGLPVIGASEKGAVDVIEDGNNGYLVPFGDTRFLMDTLKQAISDKDLLIKMGAYGRSLVIDNGKFSYAAFVERSRTYLLESMNTA